MAQQVLFVVLCTTVLGACRSTGADGPVEPGAGDATTGSTAGTPTTGSTTSGTTTTPTGGEGGVTPDGLRYIGRVPSDSNTLSWSASAVEIAFAGTTGQMQFTVINGNNYVGLSVDGGNITRTFVQTKTAITFGPLANGNHVVRATKLSEARLGEMVFNGFTTDGAPVAVSTPARRIEFIGDSITAAYGIDGTNPCTNTPALEDATQSYATLSAGALTSDVSLVAWAGKGMIRNDTSDLTADPVVMPDYWPRYIAANANTVYPFAASAAPQVVVIALGTNDYEYTSDGSGSTSSMLRSALDQNAFVAGYVAFVQNVQAKYPQAKFVLCSSPMLSDSYPTSADAQHSNLLANLNSVAAQLPNSDVVVLDFPTLTTDQATGCGGHPSVAAHQTMATLLTAKIQQLMGW